MIDKIQGILKFLTLPADKSSHAMYGLWIEIDNKGTI